MKLLFIFLFLSSIVDAKNYEHDNIKLSGVQKKIISQSIFKQSSINQNTYHKFWKNSYFEFNSSEMNRLKEDLIKEFSLNLEIWKSAKKSFILKQHFETYKLKEFTSKKKLSVKEQKKKDYIDKIIFSSIFQRPIVDKNNNTTISLNLLLIENYVQKQKESLLKINTLFSTFSSQEHTINLKNAEFKTNLYFHKNYLNKHGHIYLTLKTNINENNIIVEEIYNYQNNLKHCILKTAETFLNFNPENIIITPNSSHLSFNMKNGRNVNIYCEKINNDMINITTYGFNKKENKKYLEILKNKIYKKSI